MMERRSAAHATIGAAAAARFFNVALTVRFEARYVDTDKP